MRLFSHHLLGALFGLLLLHLPAASPGRRLRSIIVKQTVPGCEMAVGGLLVAGYLFAQSSSQKQMLELALVPKLFSTR